MFLLPLLVPPVTYDIPVGRCSDAMAVIYMLYAWRCCSPRSGS